MQQSFVREMVGVIMRAVVVMFSIVGTIFLLIFTLGAIPNFDTGISDGYCNIAVLPVEGTILPFHGIGDFDLIVTPETIESFMAAAEEDELIDAVLLEINSPGGTPVASERIADRFKNSPLPVVGVIGDMAASGGYMVASAVDYLIASRMSSVGSIGVNMSYVEESQKNEEEGLTYVQLVTGKFKDAGSPDRPITEEERAKFMADLEVIHNVFIDIVSNNRDLDRNLVSSLADGSTMTGARAINTGLVDELGGRNEAQSVLAKILGMDRQEISFCEYDSGLFGLY